jgi:hypothetical protein
VGEPVQAVQHVAAEGVQDRLAHRALADGVDQLGLERLHPAVEEVLFGREVVVDRALGDVGGPCHLGHGDRVEAPVAEQPVRRRGDQRPGLALLALSKPRPGAHARSLASRLLPH